MGTHDRPLDAGSGAEGPSLAQRAVGLAGWAARRGYSFTRRLPGMDIAERGVRRFEHRLLSEFRRRLDEVDDPHLATLSAASAMNRPSANGALITVASARDGHSEPLRSAMAALLDRSTRFGRERAKEYLYAVILRQLTPDEARILSVLSDGSPFPLVDVAERTNLGSTGRVVLRNASTVGKAAGVSLVDQVPDYLTRLLGLGLIELDEEAPALEGQYEILMTDERVRQAESSLKRVKFIRRTVRLSRLGVQFWAASDPAGH